MGANGWSGLDEWVGIADYIAPTITGGSERHGGPDLGPTRARQAWAQMGIDGIGIADSAPSKDFNGMPRLTLRMVARIQAFPDEWIFVGTKTRQHRPDRQCTPATGCSSGWSVHGPNHRCDIMAAIPDGVGTGGRRKILDFLLQHVGEPVTTKSISEASGRQGQYGRRLRELRNEFGYDIASHKDDNNIPTDSYILRSPQPGKYTFKRTVSARTRIEVLTRNGLHLPSVWRGGGRDPSRHRYKGRLAGRPRQGQEHRRRRHTVEPASHVSSMQSISIRYVARSHRFYQTAYSSPQGFAESPVRCLEHSQTKI